MNRSRWLTAGAAMLVAASTVHAQLDERKDTEIFGRAAAQQRAPGPLPSIFRNDPVPDDYPQTLSFRNGCELRGAFLARTGSEILWQRPDASEVLRVPRSEVEAAPTTRLVRNELNDDALDLHPEKSKGVLQKSSLASAKATPHTDETPTAQLYKVSSFAGCATAALAAIPSLLFFDRQPSPVPFDLLIFKNGDELAGRLLSATAGGPVHWRTTHGQEVDFQMKRIAGVCLGSAARARRTPAYVDGAALIELRTGERIRGRLIAFDEKQLHLDHAALGTVTLGCPLLWHLYPDAQLGPVDGGRSPDGWKWTSQSSRESATNARAMDGGYWMYLDGTYARRGNIVPENVTAQESAGLEHAIDPRLDRFEVRFEIATEDQSSTSTGVTLGSHGGKVLSIFLSSEAVNWGVRPLAQQGQGEWHRILLDRMRHPHRARALRVCVDARRGAYLLLVNGQSIPLVSKAEGERLQEPVEFVRLQPRNSSPVFSNLWIGPWSGETPRPAAEQPASITLRNGDVMTDIPKGWRDGEWEFTGDFGPLKIPANKVLAIDFGGTMQSGEAVGRVRLTDGSSLNLDTFEWDSHKLAAHSTTFGSLYVDASAISELIFEPALPRAPLPLYDPAKSAGQKPGAPEEGLHARQCP